MHQNLLPRPSPLVWLSLAFLCGILLQTFISFPIMLLTIAAVPLLVVCFYLLPRYPRGFMIAAMVLLAVLGALRLGLAQYIGPRHVFQLSRYGSAEVTVYGIVRETPNAKKRTQTFAVQAQALEQNGTWERINGTVLARYYDKATAIHLGDRVICQGKLFVPYPFELSQRLTYRQFLARKGIYSILSVRKGNLQFAERSGPGMVARLRHRLISRSKQYFSPTTAAMVNAMLWGQRSDTPEALEETLRHTGTVHVLAVSGLHVGMVTLVLFCFWKLCALPFFWRFVLTIGSLCGYCVLTGCRASIVRATIMAVVYLSSFLLKRRYDGITALGVAALLILGYDPRQVYSLGFQLSFLSVLSIFLFTGVIGRLLQRVPLFGVSWLRNAAAVSLAAWLGTAGVIAYTFHLITPVAVVANICIVPLVTGMVAGGSAFFVVGSLLPWCAVPFAHCVEVAAAAVYGSSRVLELLPGAWVELPAVPFYVLIVYYAALVTLYGIAVHRLQTESIYPDVDARSYRLLYIGANRADRAG